MSKKVFDKVNDFALELLKEENIGFEASEYHRIIDNVNKYGELITQAKKISKK